ncbi:MAG: methyltransferase domain-containing protein [Acidobacteria bacterium]|nr:methyltransferase domain-containing protein [Acidobacteriota bacterium]
MQQRSNLRRLNIGCGATPTPGWVNYDGSIGVHLAAVPALVSVMTKIGLLSNMQNHLIAVVKQEGIKYANAVKRIPEPDHSADVLYTCHMLEHLDRREAELFLKEARRVLIPNGIIRIAVPDLKYHIENYLKDQDADIFVQNIQLAINRPAGLIEKLKHLIVGERHHLWMYDGASLCRLLLESGFRNPQVLGAGQTTIRNPGRLDLAERSPESVFVEAFNLP